MNTRTTAMTTQSAAMKLTMASTTVIIPQSAGQNDPRMSSPLFRMQAL